MATQPITAPKPMIDPKDELILKLTEALKITRRSFYRPEETTILDEIIREGELGAQQ